MGTAGAVGSTPTKTELSASPNAPTGTITFSIDGVAQTPILASSSCRSSDSSRAAVWSRSGGTRLSVGECLTLRAAGATRGIFEQVCRPPDELRDHVVTQGSERVGVDCVSNTLGFGSIETPRCERALDSRVRWRRCELPAFGSGRVLRHGRDTTNSMNASGPPPTEFYLLVTLPRWSESDRAEPAVLRCFGSGRASRGLAYGAVHVARPNPLNAVSIRWRGSAAVESLAGERLVSISARHPWMTNVRPVVRIRV